ncbi:MAG: hypothetical protein K2J84_06590, partial [Bacteroidaceae bacterium]|nr:hypothetical protein [Bacteroidaceae bacterium]
GHNGYKVTGPNGNSIFLPAAGCRYGSSPYGAGCILYWSSVPLGGDYAYSLENTGPSGLGMYWDLRYNGLAVRPVSE